MKPISIIFIIVFFLYSCVSYQTNTEGGIRVNNPNKFKYNKHRFTTRQKQLIDTNAIYLLDSIFNPYYTPLFPAPKTKFVRFFSGGQLLFVKCLGMPSLAQINNPNLGIQAYYFVDKDILKTDRFEELNGGQTGKYFGRILPNGDIKFFEERPTLFFGSIKTIEKGEYTIWKKIPVAGIDHYKPSW